MERLEYLNQRRQDILQALADIDHQIFMLGYMTIQDTLFDDEEDWIARGEN